jgi:membrane protein
MSRPFQFIKDVIRGWLAADAFTLAASLAYYAIFAIAPLLLLSIQLASLFFDRTEAVTGLTNELVDVIGPTGSDAIKQMLDAAGTSEPQGWTGWLGIAVLLFAATGFVGSLQDALDRIWNAPPRPAGVWAFIRTKLFSFSLILAAAFLLLVSLVLSTAMTALTGRVTGMLALSEQAVALVVAFVNFLLAAAIFAAIFKYVPRAAVTWRAALAGGLFTAVLFAAGRFALGWYLGREAEASAYGAATSLVLLLVWVYYSSQILFLGAQFSRCMQVGENAPAQSQATMAVSPKPDIGIPVETYFANVVTALGFGFLLGAVIVNVPRRTPARRDRSGLMQSVLRQIRSMT